MTPRRPASVATLPESLRGQIDRAGYYPALVADVVATALGGEELVAHLVHLETTFDAEEVRRHVTVLAVTPTRLVVAHADDHGPDESAPTSYASASTEAVPLRAVQAVTLQHLVTTPEKHRAGMPPHELTLTVGWGAVQRLDLEPAGCADPQCDADHGYTGTLASDDIVIRVSSAAEGGEAVARALEFARLLSGATARVGA